MDDMLKTSHILQIGPSNWEGEIEVPKGLGWHYFSSYGLPSLQEYMEENEVSEFKALILDRPEDLLHLKDDLECFKPYTVFYDKSFERNLFSEELEYLLRWKKVQAWDFSDKEKFIFLVDRFLYDKQYGDAFSAQNIRIRPDFLGVQTVLGKHFLQVDGCYGKDFTPLAQWNFNYVYKGTTPI